MDGADAAHWASPEHLGIALSALGERENGTERLEEASLYRLALEEWTPERMPLLWASTQKNLDLVLKLLGRREKMHRIGSVLSTFRQCVQDRLKISVIQIAPFF